MSIGTICNRDVVIARRDTAIQEAARLMREYHVGDLVVIDDSDKGALPVGMLTDRDLVVEVMAEGLDPDSVTVGDIMSPNVISGDESDSVWATLQRMRVKGVRRLPVVNHDGTLAGILTMDDLLELLGSEVADLSKIVSREQDREKSARSLS